MSCSAMLLRKMESAINYADMNYCVRIIATIADSSTFSLFEFSFTRTNEVYVDTNHFAN